MNPFDIGKPYIKIAKSELLFEQYIIALNQEKYYIEVRNDDTIERNQIFFDFMQQAFNFLDGLYMHENFFWWIQSKKINWGSRLYRKLKNWTEKKRPETKINKVHLSLLHWKAVLWIKQPEQVEQQVTPTIQISMLTYHNGVNQKLVKRKILEYVSVGEKLILIFKMKKWKEKVVEWKRLK